MVVPRRVRGDVRVRDNQHRVVAYVSNSTSYFDDRVLIFRSEMPIWAFILALAIGEPVELTSELSILTDRCSFHLCHTGGHDPGYHKSASRVEVSISLPSITMKH